MKKKLLSGASIGLGFAGIASLIARFNGFNSETLTLFLYMYVGLAVVLSLKNSVSLTQLAPDLLNRIVLVVEGEELKMKKLFTGEKYRLKGQVEKI